MTLDELRFDIAKEQKSGMPFIAASIVLWGMITIVTLLNIPVKQQNILVFCCSCPLIPLAMIIGKIFKVDLFSKNNPLSKAGFLFTMNQMLYILIVMWVFNAVPEKMVMVYAMVFGAHLLPYSWLYISNAYKIFSIIIPIIALISGVLFNATIVASLMCICELCFLIMLVIEVRKYN